MKDLTIWKEWSLLYYNSKSRTVSGSQKVASFAIIILTSQSFQTSATMFYIYTRYVLIAFFLILGSVLYLQIGISAAWYLFAASGLLLLSHLFFGNVWLAFNYLKTGALEKAVKVLSHTWVPSLLLKSNKAYYFFTKGMIALQRKDLDNALGLIEQASTLGLKHNNDNALAHLNLAHIHFVQKNKDKAKQYLASATQFQPTDLMIKDNLQKLEQALK